MQMTESRTKTHSTHLVWTDGAEGFFSRVRGQGKRVDFGQMGLYVKLHARTHKPCRTNAEKTEDAVNE